MGYIGAGVTRFNTADELTVTGDARIDTTTLVVDSTNNRVGVGTASPATALDVTGTVTADGLTVDNGASQTDIQIESDTASNIKMSKSGVDYFRVYVNDTNTQIRNLAATPMYFKTNDTNRALISSAGDVALYADDGTTQGFYWDASTQYLGLGVTAPSVPLHINTSGTSMARFVGGNNGNLYITNDSTDVVTLQAAGGDALAFNTNGGNERLRITSSGNVGIGTAAPEGKLHIFEGNSGASASTNADGLFIESDGQTGITIGTPNTQIGQIRFSDPQNDTAGLISYDHSGDYMRFNTNGSEVARFDSSGNLLAGTTDTSPAGNNVEGISLGADGQIDASRSGAALNLNRIGSNGTIANFRKDGSKVGEIGVSGTNLYIVFRTEAATDGVGLTSSGSSTGIIIPADGNGAPIDDHIDLGSSGYRFDDIYATNGTIQTSDINEKQDIEALSDAEQRVAVAAKGLLRKFRWKSAVEEKGDDARIHFGIIAQDLKAAFEAEGLDAGRYAMFIHSEWTDEETGEPRSRMGVRYSELLAFIIAAI